MSCKFGLTGTFAPPIWVIGMSGFSLSFAAEWIVGVDLGDDFFAEDHFARRLDFGFIVTGGVSHDFAEAGVMIERLARGVEFELGAFKGETFAGESELLVGVFLVAHPQDPSTQRFELLRGDAR